MSRSIINNKLPKIKVQQMTSRKGTHNFVPNQYIIYANGLEIFQSYQTIIAVIDGEDVYLDEENWNYSRTTSAYRNIFLDETTEETKKNIKSGKYALTNLNER